MRLSLLRFKEFQSSWKERHLSEIVGRLESGVSVNSEDFPASKDEYGILKTSCIANGYFFEHENKKIVATEIKRAKLNPSADSILVSRMNTPQLVGEVGYVRKSYPHLFVPDRLWLIEVADKERDSTKWLSQQLTTKRLKNVFSNIASGTSGSMKNIAQPNFLKIEISTPDFEEQTKIADFLTAIDKKISFLTQKHDLLTQYKNGVMQKIFSQELRFKDDDGQDFPEWEEQPLGDVLESIIGGGTPSREIAEYYNGNIPWVTVKDLSDDNYKDSTIEYISKSGLKNSASKIIPKNSFIISTRMGLGRGFINQVDMALNQDMKGLIVKPDLIDTVFLMQWYKDNATKLQNLGIGSTVKGIDLATLKSFILHAPALAEQTKIANFLTAIEEKITVTQTQLKAVKQYKQGLLQQMFV